MLLLVLIVVGLRGCRQPRDEYDVTISRGEGKVADHLSIAPEFIRSYLEDREDDPGSIDVIEMRAVDKEEKTWVVWYRAKNKHGALVLNKRRIDFAPKGLYDVQSSQEISPDSGW